MSWGITFEKQVDRSRTVRSVDPMIRRLVFL